jgi:hypothetical protein
MLQLMFPREQGWIDGSEVAVDLFRVQSRQVKHEVSSSAPEAASGKIVIG